jgi:hypothetical protein
MTYISDAYTEVAMDKDIHMATKTIHKWAEQGRFPSRLKMRRYSKTKQKFQNKKTSDFQVAWKCEDIRKLCYNVREHVCFMYAFVYVCVYAVFMHTRACLKI